MRSRDLFFCLAVIAGLILISKIPFSVLFNTQQLYTYSKDFKAILIGLIVFYVYWKVTTKYKFFNPGKHSNFKKNNYWMFLIPLAFPGLLLASKFNIQCYTDFFSTVILLLAIYARAFVEEIVFRGFIQGYLTKQYPEKSPHQICLVTAIFFALIHFNNVQYNELSGVINQVIYAFYMGLLFSALLIKTKNIWLLGVVHGTLNFITSSCSTKSLLSDNPMQNSIAEYFTQTLGIVILFSPILLIYWLLLNANQNTVIDKV